MAGTGYTGAAGFERRPVLPSDAPALARLALAVFGPGVDRDPAIVELRAEHLVRGCDPASAVAERPDGTLVGVSLVRRLGPIVLLAWAAVDEREQGLGVMKALLEEFPALEGGSNRVILSTPDPRAMRRYGALGLALHPAVSACGVLRPGAVTAPPGAEQCTPSEAATILDALAVDVRGAPLGRDLDLLEAQGDVVHLVDDRAAVVRGGGVIRLAYARDEHAAALALRAALAAAPPGATIHLNQLRAGMDWAIGTALAAGLDLSPEGPVFADEPLSTLHVAQGSLC